MDDIFTTAGAPSAPQAATSALFHASPIFREMFDPENVGKKHKKKSKKKRKSKKDAEVARLAYGLGAMAYKNEVLSNMLKLALAAKRGTLREEPIEVGFEVLK